MTWHKGLSIPVKKELLLKPIFPLPSTQSIYNLSIHLLIRQSTCARHPRRKSLRSDESFITFDNQIPPSTFHDDRWVGAP